MHSRESVLIVRPGGTGIVAQTLFYEPEIRRERQYRADRSLVTDEELGLALRIIETRTSPFDPLHCFDSYRQRVQELIGRRIAGQKASACEAASRQSLLQVAGAQPRCTKAEDLSR